MYDTTFWNVKEILTDLEKEQPCLKKLIEDETNDDNINYDGKKFKDIKINCENEVEWFELRHKYITKYNSWFKIYCGFCYQACRT
jgi:hypothetical protein